MNIWFNWRKTNKTRWEGPCGDSFCYASCDIPSCRYDLRLGDTPAKHNQKVDELHKERAKHLNKLYPGLSEDLWLSLLELIK